MDCSQIEKLLAVHPDDLTNQERADIQDHIRTCDECKKEFVLMGNFDSLISSSLDNFAQKSPSSIPEPAPATQNKQEFKHVFSMPMFIWAAAATILLIAGVVYHFTSSVPMKREMEFLKAEIKEMKDEAQQAKILAVRLEEAKKQAGRQAQRITELEKRSSSAPRTVNFNFFGNRKDQAETARALFPAFPIKPRNYQGVINNETIYH